MSTISQFLSQVAEERRGFKFGEPHRLEPNSLSVILPIIRKTSVKRQYVTLPEVEQLVEIIDTGKINRVKINNKSTENVFLRSGTLLRGKTQERATTRSSILFPGKEIEVDVRCVHATKGIKSSESITGKGFTPLSLDQQVYSAGYTPKDQHSYWSGVRSFSLSTQSLRSKEDTEVHSQSNTQALEAAVLDPNSFMPAQLFAGPEPVKRPLMPGPGLVKRPLVPGSYENEVSWVGDPLSQTVSLGQPSSPTMHTLGYYPEQPGDDDLVSVLDEVCSSLDGDILSKIECVENQVGLALISEKGCQCIELFDVSASWRAIHQDAVKRVGAEAARKDEANVFEFKPQYVSNTVAAILSQEFKQNVIFEHRPSNGEPLVRITGLTHDKFVGEVVEVDNRVMHLNIIRLS